MMASLFVLSFMAIVLVIDYAAFRKSAKRLLVLEFGAFALGAVFVIFPSFATYCANAVGIGRGVDFLLYPLVIWLVRETFVSRHRQWQESDRLAELIRALAIGSQQVLSAPHASDPPPSVAKGAAGIR